MSADVPRNIQAFNRVVALVLADLYERFPVPVDIDPTDVGTEACDGFTEDEEEIFVIISSVAEETITFLGQEGIVRCLDSGGLDEAGFHSVRLTMKGLALLGRVPAGIDAPAETFGSQIRAAADRGAADYLSNLVGQLFNASIGMGWRAVAGV